MNYAVIMAGGAGTRFWPASRHTTPKQLLSFLSDRNLLQQTVARIRPLFDPTRILIVTSEHLGAAIAESCPEIPRENILLEPYQRNTAPCIGLAAMVIHQREPGAVMAVLPADHYIANDDEFLEVIGDALAYASSSDRMVTLGITPTAPSTAYGYLKFGEFEDCDKPVKHRARTLQAFVEKPDAERALSFIQQGRYLWNSGLFIFSIETILKQIAEHLPALYEGLQQIGANWDSPSAQHTVSEVFERAESISIDYGVMERAEGMLVIPSSFGWSDVGSWDALHDFANSAHGNFVHGPIHALESAGNVLYSNGPLITAIGVEQLVVVATPDAVLVCPRDRAQQVKTLVGELKELGKTEVL